jgi:hypothetical protein
MKVEGCDLAYIRLSALITRPLYTDKSDHLFSELEYRSVASS